MRAPNQWYPGVSIFRSLLPTLSTRAFLFPLCTFVASLLARKGIGVVQFARCWYAVMPSRGNSLPVALVRARVSAPPPWTSYSCSVARQRKNTWINRPESRRNLRKVNRIGVTPGRVHTYLDARARGCMRVLAIIDRRMIRRSICRDSSSNHRERRNLSAFGRRLARARPQQFSIKCESL